MKYLLLLTAGILLSAIAYTQGCSVNYVEPGFQISKTDITCTPNTGAIQVINQTGGVAPFTYTLVETNTTNTSGVFTNLGAGLYTVELRDHCGTVRTRQVTLVPFSFSFQFTVSKTTDCSDGEVVFTVSPNVTGYEYGVVVQGDTTWSNSNHINIKLYKTMIVFVKDACGSIQSQTWHAPLRLLPYIDALQYRLQCDKFDLFPSYYGFEEPEVCLYEFGTDKLIACKTGPASYTGGSLTNFFDIPWGAYYVIVKDKCYRDSMYHPDMRSAGGSELNPYNWDCTTFTMHVDGMEDTVCLYDAVTDRLISCKGQDTVSINPRTGLPWPSGAVWENLPYGSYYAWIYDPCEDSTFKIDSTVTYPFSTYMVGFAGCSLNQTTIQANFNPESKKPYTVNVLNSNGTLNSSFVTSLADNYFGVTPSVLGGPFTVIGTDACGYADTVVVQPQIMPLSKSISIVDKCPGVSGNSGSGDVEIFASTSSHVKAIPQIIKKNGVDNIINYSFNSNDTYQFPNLLSGVYIFKYSFSSCAQMTLYDTVRINEYIYPTQNPLTALQCGGNMFTFTFPIVGGLNPYTYQIIGNTPVLPSLVSATQSGPIFTIGNGQHYTNVKVRAIDRCGNSTIGDVAVEPVVGCTALPVDSIERVLSIRNKLVKVYPNPSHNYFIVSFNNKKKANYKIEVINATGIKVVEQNIYNIDQKEIVINEQLIPGVYFITIINASSGDRSIFKQIVKQ